jgi:hypothetical protein
MMKPSCAITVADALNRTPADVQTFSDSAFSSALMRIQKNFGPMDDAASMFPAAYDTLYLFHFLPGELNDVFMRCHIPPAYHSIYQNQK